MSELLDKLQQELTEDVKALDALEAQLTKAIRVSDILKGLPDSEAAVVLGVGVGSDAIDVEVNLRGLDSDLVAALLGVVARTQCTLKQKIQAIQAKYPGNPLVNPDGVKGPRPQVVEQHIHYHYHNDVEGQPVHVRPPKPYDDPPGCPPPPPPHFPPVFEDDPDYDPDTDPDLADGEPVNPEDWGETPEGGQEGDEGGAGSTEDDPTEETPSDEDPTQGGGSTQQESGGGSTPLPGEVGEGEVELGEDDW